ncbi:MAG: hypothetical protein G01um101491_231 [Parcubacteria group bacterium Gr01-1014_91]|nr:MAG: hypothetical protein G01um101491_231 [Parcubacteria group bacterium Gr01-1014_91]
MLTKDDKKWVEEKLTKEIKPLRDSMDLLRGKITNIHFEKFNLEARLDSIEASTIRTEEKIDKMFNIMDGNAGRIAELDQENKMGARTLHRHDIQIHELATATGTTISE